MNRYCKDLGDFGEYVAADFLEAKGYHILERNYHCSGGELDIIAEKGKFLVFVEVKTRSSEKFGAPAESVTRKKQEHLLAAARGYLMENPTKKEIRFDVMEILANIQDSTPYLQSVNHIEDVVLEEIN